MTKKELEQKTAAERLALVHELRLNVQSLRFEASTGKKQNIKALRDAKKTIARIRTIEASGA